MSEFEHIDEILTQWPYDPTCLSVRIVQGLDGRDVLQLRMDMGLLQLEMDGRPDGSRPGGFETYLDYLLQEALQAGDDYVMDEAQFREADREFVQFYHRRICWLRLQNYRRATDDANHTLTLMDFCQKHSPDEQWTWSHEQYRPFVLFHRTQAVALAKLDDEGPEAAVHEINCGLEELRQVFEKHEILDRYEDDEIVTRLKELRESLRREYEVGRTLHEQLADAIAAEQYERAAIIRDELSRRFTGRKRG